MLKIIPKHFIILSQSLSFLSLKKNPLGTKFTKFTLTGLNVNFLSTSHFSLCCIVHLSRNGRCSLKRLWYMPCSHLLLNLPINIAFYIVTLVILMTNMLSIYHAIKNNNTKSSTRGVFNAIVTFIGIVDITGSIPLVILWGNDLYFKDDFVFTIEEWKSSIICFISSGISIHFVLIAPFLHILLSYVRYNVIKNPFDVTFKRTEFTFTLITFGYSCSLLFASFLTILFWLISGKMPNVHCSPFVDPSETFSLAVISSFFLMSIHFLLFY